MSLNYEKQDPYILGTALSIRRLLIDHLHVVGDTFDRGAGSPSSDG